MENGDARLGFLLSFQPLLHEELDERRDRILFHLNSLRFIPAAVRSTWVAHAMPMVSVRVHFQDDGAVSKSMFSGEFRRLAYVQHVHPVYLRIGGTGYLIPIEIG